MRIQLLLLTILGTCSFMVNDVRAESGKWAIAIHGGAIGRAESLSQEERAAMEVSLAKALKVGQDILAGGGKSLDAVEQVVRLMEDDPLFNAGRGAVLNSAGRHELDASIMDGNGLKCGAVAGVRTVKNPISLARRVMERTRHVLLVADGAEKFADEQGVERADEDYFRTSARVEELQKLQAAQRDQQPDGACEDHMGTVGCVALDQHGQLAAATSTGGLVNKKYGRVGDSPIIGAGTYADNATCAISCTGVGEEYIRRSIAYDISAQLKYRQVSLEAAVRNAIEERLPASSGGIIAVSQRGELMASFNTPGMCRALADSQGRKEVSVGK